MTAADSMLRSVVYGHLERTGYTLREAARLSGVSEGTLKGLGKASLGPQDSTLEALAGFMGRSFDELAMLRTVDVAVRYGGPERWPGESYRIGACVALLSPERRRMALRVMAALVDDSPGVGV